MLKITTELMNGLKQNNILWEIINEYVSTIIKCGSKSDSDILFEYYLSNPFDSNSSCLFPLFEKFGDTSYSEKLLQIYIENPKIVEESHSEILSILGYFKNNCIKEKLIEYAFINDSDFYLCRSSVLGLIHFDCTKYEERIEAEIIKCYNKNLFHEYVPALVCKLTHKDKILSELFILGNEYASTDCIAGIVLGFSLCGNIGKNYFMKAINSPHWEVALSGTGTISNVYRGIKNLNISFNELYLNIKKEKDNDQLEHLLNVFFALLEIRIDDNDEDLESFTELYNILFEWDNKKESINLIDLSMKVDKEDEAYILQKTLTLKVKEELILRSMSLISVNAVK